MTCIVRDIIGGGDAITLDDGQRVYGCVHTELAAGHPVELDFAGVSVFASQFFNAALGQLLKDHKPEDLNRLLKILHLSPAGLAVARRVIENSKRYYDEPNYREAQRQVLQAMSEGN
ncbi:MAG: STAS-like domain-containing protein [Planctomycetia bacterium]|nr:STAS-like domain-containing protein [Planctomycetia bacterium]